MLNLIIDIQIFILNIMHKLINKKKDTKSGNCIRIKSFKDGYEKDIVYHYKTYYVKKTKMYNIYKDGIKLDNIGYKIFNKYFVTI